MKRLLEGLREEHRNTRYILDLISLAADRWEAGDPIAIDLFVRGAGILQEYADDVHQNIEEKLLFPIMEREGVPHSGGPLEVLEAEHEECRGYLVDLQTALGKMHRLDPSAREEIAENIKSYTHMLKAHMDKEELVVFPIAERLLGESTVRSGEWTQKSTDPQRRESLRQLIQDFEHKLGLEGNQSRILDPARSERPDRLTEEFLHRGK